MIPRYTPKEFAQLWSDRRRFETWFDVELAACEAMERAGHVPAGTAAQVRPFRDQLEPAKIDEIEAVTRHDVIAFLTHVEQLAGAPARWLHLGMTSSDVLDSSLAIQLRDATDGLIKRSEALLEAFRGRIEEHRKTPLMGRSHGIHAEPTTFGIALAGHFSELARAQKRLVAAREEIAVGKIAGAVGSYAHLTPEIELEALGKLGLKPESVATQVVARDRHAALASAMAGYAAAIERFATNVRHWQRTEVGEAEEFFNPGQKGSSAMPHKRNPVLTENLCGLARVVRGAVTPLLENVALWHERDISHSSVERMLLPDATSTLAFMLDRTKGVIEKLVVYPERLRENLERTGGLWASEGILLALVEKGKGRQDGYVLVQRNAMKAFRGEGDFKTLLLADADIREHLGAKEIEAAFDLSRALRHADFIIDRALADAKR
jgi:adenylosuccinate lyase